MATIEAEKESIVEKNEENNSMDVKNNTDETPMDQLDKVADPPPNDTSPKLRDGTEGDPKPVFKMPIIAPRLGVKKSSVTAKEFTNDKEPALNPPKQETKEKPEKTEPSRKLPSKLINLSPAELLKQQSVPIPYKEPSDGGISDKQYSFEVVKNGTVIDKLDLTTKSYFIVGRLPSCDFPMEHPSLSRHHAVIQHFTKKTEEHDIGWYLYDLDSTHGTWINKYRVKPRVYNRIRVGYVLKFGGSTRLHILQGPDEDADEESELSITEMKEQREKQKKEAEVLKAAELAEIEEKKAAFERAKADEGCSWGIDDAAVTEDSTENPFALPESTNEELYLDDPKKALRGFYEREGLDLPEYKVDEEGRGKFRCAVELPLDGPNGEPIIAEATVSGKKREAVAACALEACRILDRMGELRKANHESRKRKSKDWAENDYYDSDEDIYLDRTGDIEKKRQQRMKRSKQSNQKAKSYEELKAELDDLVAQIGEIQAKLDKAKSDAAAYEDIEGVDALDAFMAGIKAGAMDTKTRIGLKKQLFALKTEQQRLVKLVNIAKPPDLPPLTLAGTSPFEKAEDVNKSLPLFGKMRGPAKPSSRQPVTATPRQPDAVAMAADDNEIEEDDEDEEEKADDKAAKKSDLSVKAGESRLQQEESVRQNGNKESSDSRIATSTEASGDSDSVADRNVGASLKPSIQERIKRLLGAEKPPDLSTAEKKTELSDTTTIEDVRKGNEFEAANQDANSEQTKEQKKKKRRPRGPRPKPAEDKMADVYATDDPKYATWVPPTDQSGDGKTSLNEKFGY